MLHKGNGSHPEVRGCLDTDTRPAPESTPAM